MNTPQEQKAPTTGNQEMLGLHNATPQFPSQEEKVKEVLIERLSDESLVRQAVEEGAEDQNRMLTLKYHQDQLHKVGYGKGEGQIATTPQEEKWCLDCKLNAKDPEGSCPCSVSGAHRTKEVMLTPSQSWEEDFNRLFVKQGLPKEMLIYQNKHGVNVSDDKIKDFIKNLLSSREELLKQRCLEEIEKLPVRRRVQEVIMNPKLANQDILGLGEKYTYAEGVSDAKEAVTRVFGDE